MWLIVLLGFSILFIVVATTQLKLHPFLALLVTAFGFGILSGMPLAELVDSVNSGFGGTIGSIGIVILAGSIIGTFLEKSGGASRLASSILRLAGEKNVPLAMGGVGFVISIPVFCDSAFVLLSSLMKALSQKAGITLSASAIALSLGLYATHTMVPPTPGPVAAAGLLEADLGLVIVWGLLVGFVALMAGWLFAVTVASKVHISTDGDEDQSRILKEGEEGPTLSKSLLPILVPIALIVMRSIGQLPARPLGESQFALFLEFLGQPVVALLIGVALAFLLPGRLERRMLSTEGWIGQAVPAAATIIVITGAGGAFGRVLQNSGIADVIGETLAGSNLGLWLPFLIAAGIKTAQGSSTVAIITTASLLAPLVDALGLDSGTARALAVVAIGAGSMVVSHANDSYFWVVTQFSNMDVKTGYRLQTLGTLVQGTVAAVVVWVLGVILL